MYREKFQNLVNFSHIPKFGILGCDIRERGYVLPGVAQVVTANARHPKGPGVSYDTVDS
jgi:hypothetical protein